MGNYGVHGVKSGGGICWQPRHLLVSTTLLYIDSWRGECDLKVQVIFFWRGQSASFAEGLFLLQRLCTQRPPDLVVYSKYLTNYLSLFQVLSLENLFVIGSYSLLLFGPRYSDLVHHTLL